MMCKKRFNRVRRGLSSDKIKLFSPFRLYSYIILNYRRPFSNHTRTDDL